MADMPEVIAEIASVAGMPAAMAIVRAKGGQRIYLPAVPKPGHWLIDLVGVDAAQKVCAHFTIDGHGDDLVIPMASAMQRSAAFARAFQRRGADRQASVDAAAAELGVHRRTVQRHFKKFRDGGEDPDQGDFFT